MYKVILGVNLVIVSKKIQDNDAGVKQENAFSL